MIQTQINSMAEFYLAVSIISLTVGGLLLLLLIYWFVVARCSAWFKRNNHLNYRIVFTPWDIRIQYSKWWWVFWKDEGTFFQSLTDASKCFHELVAKEMECGQK